MSVLGIDVAVYQSSTYSTSGIAFAFVKATEHTNYINPRHAAQVTRARNANLVVGHYHFLWPGNIQGQAEYFVEHASVQPGDILACDWETTGGKTRASSAEKDAFIKAVQKLRPRNKVVLYCNTSFWKSYDTSSFAGDGLWIADPNHPAGQPSVTHPWVFQQYSSAGGTDRNIANFPSAAALKAWAAGSEPNVTTHDPLTAADAKTVWGTDGIIPAPKPPVAAPDAKTNPSWTAGNALADAQQQGRETNANTQALLTQQAVMSNTLTAVQKQVAAIAALTDPDAVAEQIVQTVVARLGHLGITLTVKETLS